MEYRVLGPLQVFGRDGPITLEGRRERAVLAALVLARGEVISTDRLLDAVWGDSPPRSAAKTVQNHVLRLRKTLGAHAIETRDPGYRLAAAADDIDAAHFERLVAAARSAVAAGDIAGALESYEGARALWRGRPFSELESDATASAEATRLTELSDAANEEFVSTALASGRHVEMIPELEAQVATEPLREHRWAMLMLALYRAGRQADALRTYQRARVLLGDELGIEPGPELRTLEIAIATQDSSLLLPAVETDRPMASGVVTVMSAPRTPAVHELGASVGARVITGTEGGVYLAFASPVACIRAAFDIQTMLRDQNCASPHGDTGIGIHAGEPASADDSSQLGALRTAADALRDRATHGQIVVSDLVRDLIPCNDDEYLLDEIGVVRDARGHDVLAYEVFDALEKSSKGRVVDPPYQGLSPFGPEDADLFFGRSSVVHDLVSRVQTEHLVALVGPSGSGKSSVLGAGLVAAVRGGALPGSASWPTALLTPTAHPVDALVSTCAAVGSGSPQALRRALALGADRFVDALRPWLAQLPAGARCTLVVDQFEELFTLCRDADERQCFVAAIAAVTTAHLPVTVVVAIRADFYGHCAALADLRASIEHGTMLLAPMDAPELLAAIDGPADLTGFRLEPGLSELIVRDVADEPGALPLMSHALLETWKGRRRRTLTVQAYLESGGVQGAIATTAERVYQALGIDEQRVARDLFLRLSQPGEGTEDTRRRAPFDELVTTADEQCVRRVLQELADARLVALDEESVEVAHEALIREWPRLRGWIDDDREGLRTHRHLTDAARDWDALGRDDAQLYRGPRLAIAEEWLDRDPPVHLNDLETSFVDASIAHAHREAAERVRRERLQARTNRRLRGLLVGTAVALVIALVAGTLAWAQRQHADHSASEAQAATKRASLERILAASNALGDEDRYLQALLLVQAARMHPSARTNGAMLEALLENPQLIAAIPVTTRKEIWPLGDGTSFETVVGDRFERWATVPRKLTFERTFSDITAATVAADGTAAIATADGHVTILDGRGHPARAPLVLPSRARAFNLAIDPSGKRLVVLFHPLNEMHASDTASSFALYDLRTGAPEDFPAPSSEYAIGTASFSPDGSLLAMSTTHGVVTVQDADTGAVVGPPFDAGELVVGMGFDPIRRRIAVASNAQDLAVWNFDTGTRVGSLDAPNVPRSAYSPDGSLLAVNGSTAVQIYDAETLQPKSNISAPAPQTGTGGLALTNSGWLFASGDAGPITVWDLHGTANRQLFSPVPGTHSYVFPMAGGRLLAAPDLADSVTLIDAHSHRPVGPPLSPGPGAPTEWPIPTTFAASYYDSHRIAVVNRDGVFQLYDVATRTPIGSPIDLGFQNDYAVFSRDLRTIAVGGQRGQLAIIDVAGDAPRLLHDNLTSPMNGFVIGLEFGPHGELYACDQAGVYRFTHVRSAEPQMHDLSSVARGVSGEAMAMDVTPDGHTMAVSHGGAVQLYDTTTLRRVGPPISATNAPISWLAYSRDGRYVVVNDSDASVRLVDTRSHQAVGPLWTGIPNAGAVFNQDGSIIGTSTPTTGALMAATPAAWADDLCALAGRNLTAAEWREYLPSEGPRRRTCPQYP